MPTQYKYNSAKRCKTLNCGMVAWYCFNYEKEVAVKKGMATTTKEVVQARFCMTCSAAFKQGVLVTEILKEEEI